MNLTDRPSRKIYMRTDDKQIWRECESAYELGYAAAQADYAAGLRPLDSEEHHLLWGADSDYVEGYRDHYAFVTSVQHTLMSDRVQAVRERYETDALDDDDLILMWQDKGLEVDEGVVWFRAEQDGTTTIVGWIGNVLDDNMNHLVEVKVGAQS